MWMNSQPVVDANNHFREQTIYVHSCFFVIGPLSFTDKFFVFNNGSLNFQLNVFFRSVFSCVQYFYSNRELIIIRFQCNLLLSPNDTSPDNICVVRLAWMHSLTKTKRFTHPVWASVACEFDFQSKFVLIVFKKSQMPSNEILKFYNRIIKTSITRS